MFTSKKCVEEKLQTLGTVLVILSDTLFKDGHLRFTTEPRGRFFFQVLGRRSIETGFWGI